MPQMICTLGDLLLDVVVRLEGPIAEDTDTYGRTRVGAGGQAANVAAWVVALGGEARFIGKRAGDPAGRLLAGELERRGVELAGPRSRPGPAPSSPSRRRTESGTMLSRPRGRRRGWPRTRWIAAWLGGCERLHLPALQRRGSADRGRGARRPRRGSEGEHRPLVDGGARAGGDRDASARLSTSSARTWYSRTRLRRSSSAELDVETLVVKRGARGCVVRTGGEEPSIRRWPAEVVDTTGAGDAFAAGFLVGGPELGARSCGPLRRQLGAMP